MEDYYAILRVSFTDTLETITRSYRQLAIQCHPDKCHNWPESTAVFQQLVRAYETLKDPDLRRQYNVEWLRHHYGTDPLYTSNPPPGMTTPPRMTTPDEWSTPPRMATLDEQIADAAQEAREARIERLRRLLTEMDSNDTEIVLGCQHLDDTIAKIKSLQELSDRLYDKVHQPSPSDSLRKYLRWLALRARESREQKEADEQQYLQACQDLSDKKAELGVMRSTLASLGMRVEEVMHQYTVVLSEDMKDRLQAGSYDDYSPQEWLNDFCGDDFFGYIAHAEEAQDKARECAHIVGSYYGD